MRRLSGFLKGLIVVWAGFTACQSEQEEITKNPEAMLRFSTDTIHFDTVFSTVGSITKRLKVYNPSKNAVVIESISLGANDSPYSIYINGRKGKSFDQKMLMGNDSLLMLVEVLIDPANEDLPFLVTDSIRFLTNGNLQQVKLISWGQDAVFTGKKILQSDAVWSSGKPIVLLDTVLVGPSSTLTIEEGTRIFADHSAALLVAGRLNITGTAEKPVLFTGSRLDIKDAYGQWRGIVFLRDSKKSRIDFCSIRNAVYGVYVGTPDNDDDADVILANTAIENAVIGLVCFGSDVHATNLLINNCAEYLVLNLAGGNYYFNHCTFSNSFAGLQFARSEPSMIFSNYYMVSEKEKIGEDLSVEMNNSIVWGNLKDEIFMDAAPESAFEIHINHSLLKTTIDAFVQNSNIINKDPKFVDIQNYNYRLDSLSPAIDAGDVNFRLPYDLSGNERDQTPDMGAYEWKKPG